MQNYPVDLDKELSIKNPDKTGLHVVFNSNACKKKGSAVATRAERLSRDRGVAGWSLTGVTALCP